MSYTRKYKLDLFRIKGSYLKFYGQFEDPVDSILFRRYFKNTSSPGFFIECGAFDGVTESCCYIFEKYLNWKGVNFEPSPPIYKKLSENRPNSLNLNLALSDKNGEENFSATTHPVYGDLFGNGSIQHSSEHYESLVRENVKFTEFKIQTIDYKTFIERYKIEKIDIFILDVEGYEVNILKTLDKTTVLPKVFVIEYTHIGLDNLNTLMINLGYALDYVSNNNAFYVLLPLEPQMLSSIMDDYMRLQREEKIDIKLKNFEQEIYTLKLFENDQVNRFLATYSQLQALSTSLALAMQKQSFFTRVYNKIIRLLKKN